MLRIPENGARNVVTYPRLYSKYSYNTQMKIFNQWIIEIKAKCIWFFYRFSEK